MVHGMVGNPRKREAREARADIVARLPPHPDPLPWGEGRGEGEGTLLRRPGPLVAAGFDLHPLLITPADSRNGNPDLVSYRAAANGVPEAHVEQKETKRTKEAVA